MNFHSPVIKKLPSKFNIGDKAIGNNNPCYVIAEAGSNHNRDLKTAIGLVDAAANAGCDAVKFQSFKTRELVTDDAKTCNYQNKKNILIKKRYFKGWK